MKKLEDLGQAENTIVIFASDNGGMSAGNFGNPKRVVRDNQLDWAYATSNLPLREPRAGCMRESASAHDREVAGQGSGRRGL